MADLLREDYKDDILDVSANELRKYQMIQNDDGTVSFLDVTEYMQTGDNFGAGDINSTNVALNGLLKEFENFSFDIHSVLTNTVIDASERTYNTYNGRKFSDYDLIIFSIGAAQTDFRQQAIIPKSVFVSGVAQIYVSANSGEGGNVFNQVSFQYASDTSVKIKTNSAGILRHTQIWGIRLRKN